MRHPVILASASSTRSGMLARAGLVFEVAPARIDEQALCDGLRSQGIGARDLADTLAEAKACRVSRRRPDAWVIGADQTLELDGEPLAPVLDAASARARLLQLRGREHQLYSAAVIVLAGQPVWRHVAVARMTMRNFSEETLDTCMASEGGTVLTTAAYRYEGPHVRLFARVEGEWHAILGLPLLEILDQLIRLGTIPE